MFKKILVPLDGSKRAEKILPRVEDLARRFSESQIVLLQVVEPIPVSVNLGDYVPPLGKGRRSTESPKLPKRILKNFERISKGRGYWRACMCCSVLLCQQSWISPRGEKVDLLALTSHGRSGSLGVCMEVSLQGYCIELTVHCSLFDRCKPE